MCNRKIIKQKLCFQTKDIHLQRIVRIGINADISSSRIRIILFNLTIKMMILYLMNVLIYVPVKKSCLFPNMYAAQHILAHNSA